NFERTRPRPDTQPLNVTAVHRIEQPRHQCEPLTLAFLMMIKDVFRHAPPARLWPATCRGQTPTHSHNGSRLALIPAARSVAADHPLCSRSGSGVGRRLGEHIDQGA